MTGGSTVGHP